MKSKHCDLMIANDVSQKDIGFNSRKNPITIQAVGSDSIRTTSLVSSFTLSADGGAVVLINTATREWWQM